ncbi:MAG TPA: methyltransferase domain-containing protein [Steroidobacteraceae bacterium]
MPALKPRAPGIWFIAALLSSAALAGGSALAADLYSDAVAQPGRTAADLKRDAIDHPAEVLRLAGIKPGMRVADFLAGNGYYSEMLSHIVGPSGHVLLLNNEAYEKWSGKRWQDRLKDNRLPNVEHRTIDVEHLDLPDHSLDAVLLIKVYHDVYWVDKDHEWPKMDPNTVLNEVARVLKPGGTLLLVDHSAKAGTGSADAGTLHRIDEAYARADFEKHGFSFVTNSDVLRRPDDPRDALTYEGPMVGKTDRFVMVFHKQ